MYSVKQKIPLCERAAFRRCSTPGHGPVRTDASHPDGKNFAAARCRRALNGLGQRASSAPASTRDREIESRLIELPSPGPAIT